ncbi:hypothetical protein TWF506_004179 [Arthrobotrys conoides]|uniref:Uncharacterized protein n=1 Tax=Arthrobotrys conoides TaxID=74498 RepID=A0AAN8N793_9PEZI
MPSSAIHSVYTETILNEDKEWVFRDSIQIPLDLGRYVKANSAIHFAGGEDEDVLFCTLLSYGCSHLASAEVSLSARSIKVTVYCLRNGLERKWTTTYFGTAGEFEKSETFGSYDIGQISGGVTEDGDSVLLLCRPASRYSQTTAYIVRENGFTKRTPPSDTDASYSFLAGSLSDDSEHIFYTRSGTAFGKRGQAQVVEVYSIRHLACVKAVTFAFGDGHHMRNTQLIRPLRVKGSVYLAITTSSFDEDGDPSPMLIASSDGKLQRNFAGLGTVYSGASTSLGTFISPDGRYMFVTERTTAVVKHWDLENPTLNPLGKVRLPEVEYAKSRRWLIYGKETVMDDAIAEQIICTRYSPGGATFTIVTVNNSMVVVNVLLTFNLQLIYNESVQGPDWPGLVPLHAGFNDLTGLNIFGMYPAKIMRAENGLLRLYGAKAILISLPQIFANIKSIESYFDFSHNRAQDLKTAIKNREATPELRFRWKAGVMNRNDADAIKLENGRWPTASIDDEGRQRRFYERVFVNSKSSVSMQSTAELRNFFVPHLLSFRYPWAPEQTVSVFGVIMKNEYYVIAIGPSPCEPRAGHDIIRALCVSDIETGDEQQQIEVYKSGPNFILYVDRLGDKLGGYSGAPIPLPRCTVISPHFLEEDAWYDTHIVHRSAHITMPTGWIHTPNPALMETANFYAFFRPNTFVLQDQILYGHRTRSVYVMPKYLLWREYGLRGLQKENPNNIFFGGGQFADRLGPYFRSIYEDKTYDDTFPLFPSTFAMVCNEAHRSQRTLHIDAFFRRLHQEKELVLENGHALSCSFPLACRARPIASLSFMRHLVMYAHKVNDIGAVKVKAGATKRRDTSYDYDNRWYRWWLLIRKLSLYPRAIWENWFADGGHPEPNTTHITLPLPGFCSFQHKLYRPPPVSGSGVGRDDTFWEFMRAASPGDENNLFTWERYVLEYVRKSGNATASPFTRLVEEILQMKDKDIQLAFLKVVWLEKLLAWKMETFGLRIFLTRKALPMLVLCISHLSISIALTGQHDAKKEMTRDKGVLLLVGIEAMVVFYIISIKVRQLYRIPRLFFRSLFNYMDGIALSISLAMFFMVATGVEPSRSFLGFSTLASWIAAILMLRIHRSIGMLLLLLTETVQGVFPFLVLLAFILLGS